VTDLSNDDAPRTPLTLEFVPEPIEDDTQSRPIVVAEPSFQHDGRIFLGVHPFGRRVGNHMLPDDVRRLRDHLSKLLMEPVEEAPAAEGEQIDWQERIRQAVARQQRPKRRRKRGPFFRVEFEWGGIQGVMGRLRGS
jgi:hypothetical protein